MEAEMGLLLMILMVPHSLETYCDGRQDAAQCYGAVGGTVVIQLMDSASEISRYQWLHKNLVILDGSKDTVIANLIGNHSIFTPSNGTFRINNLSRADGGGYTLLTFDSGGNTSKRTLQLTIQAPVSSVLLVPECLSQGELRVSCSSEGGDSPQYSWTLDGHTLTDAELLSGNAETSSITLKQNVSGQLVCSVRNNVSHVLKEEKISTCGIDSLTTVSTINTVPEASSGDNFLLICGVRAAVVILALIGIVCYFAWKKKKYKMAEGSAVRQQMEYQNSVVMVDMRSSER